MPCLVGIFIGYYVPQALNIYKLHKTQKYLFFNVGIIDVQNENLTIQRNKLIKQIDYTQNIVQNFKATNNSPCIKEITQINPFKTNNEKCL